MDMLNEVHRTVFTQNTTSHMRMYDSSTGVDPILTTTDSIYVYEIDTDNGFDDNAWRVVDVYTDEIDDPVDVIKYDATPGISAKVVFQDNPGTATYYIRAYRQCNNLTSENIQLEIPHSYHISHVWQGLCGIIEKYRSGKSDRWDFFEQKLLPELVLKISENQSGTYNVSYKGY